MQNRPTPLFENPGRAQEKKEKGKKGEGKKRRCRDDHWPQCKIRLAKFTKLQVKAKKRLSGPSFLFSYMYLLISRLLTLL
jgi:hypothetical protein